MNKLKEEKITVRSAAAKVLVLMLVLMLAFGLMACGDTGNDQNEPEPANTTEPDTPEDEAEPEITVEPGLEEIADADWGVCLRGNFVKYELGMEVSKDWDMEGTLTEVDESMATREIGMTKDESGEKDCYYSRMDTKQYSAVAEVDIPALAATLEEAYGITVSADNLEKALKETYDRAAYYIVPEGGEYTEPEESDEEYAGEGGTYLCSIGQTATVKAETYSETVLLRIYAQQVQIGEAAMYVHAERTRINEE